MNFRDLYKHRQELCENTDVEEPQTQAYYCSVMTLINFSHRSQRACLAYVSLCLSPPIAESRSGQNIDEVEVVNAT